MADTNLILGRSSAFFAGIDIFTCSLIMLHYGNQSLLDLYPSIKQDGKQKYGFQLVISVSMYINHIVSSVTDFQPGLPYPQMYVSEL
jgi:predicted ABC-type exoprotein transport system permease subunit